MTNKTISINPALFNMGGSRTKKSREKKQKPTVVPLMSPSVLKNKLLRRIKEHKQRETVNLENKNVDFAGLSKNDNDAIKQDEFMESIEYLKTLSEERKRKSDQAIAENKRQQQKQNIERNTVKHYQSVYSGGTSPIVNLELPTELSMPMIEINTDIATSAGGGFVPYKNDVVPYGILKGGQKQTYRDWNKTQRNNIVTDSNLALTIQGGQGVRTPSVRERRLAMLRNKLTQQQQPQHQQQEQPHQRNAETTIDDMLEAMPPNTTPTSALPIVAHPASQVNNQMVQMAGNTNTGIQRQDQRIATKRTTTKTTKRKYTLGKSKTRNSVAVLIKDRGTRKQILNAQKDLKKKSMNEVKAYLRDHNLIKAGSNAPNDITRKMYEYAMLAGEIKNSNAETLLHNFSKEDKEL